MLRMYYFSGTGNARNVARWVVDAWRARGRPAEAIDLTTIRREYGPMGPDDEIGLASPTHGFNFPPVTLSFLFAFPRTAYRNRVFIINTRAGVRFFGACLPGLSGLAQLLSALVFLLKGYRVVGMRPIDLPSNWISIHPGLREDNIKAIYARCEAIARRSAQKWLDGQRDLRALFDLPQDLAIAPISLSYYFIGRYLFAKSFIASHACNACGLCIRQCPISAISMRQGRPFWSYRCESCMRCMNQCPSRAIETAHGFIVGLLTLLGIAAPVWIYPTVASWVPALSGTGFIAWLVQVISRALLMLSILFLAYRLLHRGLRFRFVERLAVLTSLTHLRSWRRYRAPLITIKAPPIGPAEGNEGTGMRGRT